MVLVHLAYVHFWKEVLDYDDHIITLNDLIALEDLSYKTHLKK